MGDMNPGQSVFQIISVNSLDKKTRVEVEINWLILISNNKSLSFIPNLSLAQQKKVLNIFNEFSIQDAREIKKLKRKRIMM